MELMKTMKNRNDIINDIIEKAGEGKDKWGLEETHKFLMEHHKAIDIALQIYEKEIINEIENWSILEMDSDIKSQDIEELKQRINLK